MYQIQQVSSNPKQFQTLFLPSGEAITLSIYFVPMQYGWFITELNYLEFTLHGLRITNSPNMLHQFRNQIPFGLACFTTILREPTQQQDFQSGNSVLYVLTSDEVEQYAEYLSGR